MDWFDAGQWITRDHCGIWSEALVRFYVSGHLAVAGAYFFIPATLFFRARQLRKTHRFAAREASYFGAFILACGIGHVLEGAVSFVWPNYRIFAAWHWLTAILSIGVAAACPLLFLRVKDEQSDKPVR